MKNKDYLEKLKIKIKNIGSSEEEITKLYNEVIEIFNSNDYTLEEKRWISTRTAWESLCMMYDAIKNK